MLPRSIQIGAAVVIALAGAAGVTYWAHEVRVRQQIEVHWRGEPVFLKQRQSRKSGIR